MAKSTALTRVLELFKDKVTVSPDQINKHVGKGNYASKYVLYLKLEGHDIETVKDGRSVVTYTYKGLNSAVDTSVKKSERRAHNFLKGSAKPVQAKKVAEPKEPVVKAEKAKVEKTVKVAKTAKPKKEKVAKDRPLMDRIVKSNDIVQETFGSDGTIGSIDTDWDDGVDDVRSLLG